MNILAIDTSCDETAAAVTQNTKILSNIVWSQASLHAKFGGVMPSLAQRMHKERIDLVVEKAIKNSKLRTEDLDAVAVTIGPGLSIALGVGVDKAKEIARKFKLPIIPVNHIEAHILSPLAKSNKIDYFPAYGLCISGGNTIFVYMEKIGKYKILAETQDDALGEALDKSARMLGLGYPGGPVLEKFAKMGNPKKYSLPIPIIGQENRMIFTYSGLKTAFYRLVEKEKPLTRQKIYDLAACFQNTAFTHLIRVINYILSNQNFGKTNYLLVGGGVAANIEARKRLRELSKNFNIKALFPYTKKLYGDNAAMIGITAFLNPKNKDLSEIDRSPALKL